MPFAVRCRLRLMSVVVLLLSFAAFPAPAPVRAAASSAVTAFVLSGTNLIPIVVTRPGTPGPAIPIVGVNANETLVDINVRPQNNRLYGLGVNATADTATLYLIDPHTGQATAVGTPGSIAFTTDGTTTVDIPDPATVGYGIDFNPAADRLRVVAGSLNFRVNPNTGGAVDGNNGGAANSVTGTNPDGAINGGTTSLSAVAYTNNQPNTSVTTLYTLDDTSNKLFIQNPPNAGTQTNPLTIQLGGATLDFNAVNGFDIPVGVNAPASNAAATGTAYAVLNVGGATGLYSIALSDGTATLLGSLGASAAQGLAVLGQPSASVALSADGAQLIRFLNTATGTTTSIAITGVNANETLVGIDGRPATGQLYGLGVNAGANTASLYLLDPQTGAATVVGAANQIAFVDAGGNAVDLPPASAGYGFDFNPSVDRLRVTTGSGLNFRVNPNTGAPVDGNLGQATAIALTNPDGPSNGLPSGSTGVAATAYTNNYGQPLAPVGPTTQYTLDAASNSLFIQNPPNAGTQTNPLTVTLGGAALDFGDVNGFDIPPGPQSTASGAAASGNGYAALTVGGTTGLYRIALQSGAATSLGAIGTGTTSLGGLAVWSGEPGLTVSATSTISEDAGSALFSLSAAATPLIVSYSIGGGTATPGSDYTPITGTLVFTASNVPQTLSVPLINDSVVESDETIVLDLFTDAPVTGPLSATIVDDDRLPALSLSSAALTVAEGATAQVTATLGFTATTPITVSYQTGGGTATPGSDYTPLTGTLVFAPGQSSQAISVPVLADRVADAGETFLISLTAAQGATLTAPTSTTVTISPDAPPAVSLSSAATTVAEGATAQVTATLEFTATTPITVSYQTGGGTATPGSDYTPLTGTLVFAPGQSSQTISVPVLADLVADTGETFVVSLTAAQGATLTAPTSTTVTISPDAGRRVFISLIARSEQSTR